MMKRISYLFFLLLLGIILFSLISSCRSLQIFKHIEQEIIITPDTIPKIVCDTLLTGRIKTVAIFENYWNDTLTNTFVITENYTISISGAYEIPDSTKGYIFIFDNNRMKAFFTWDGDTTLHKILK